MSKRCELTGISPLKGHNVSHAKNKTKRRFLPNLKKVTFRSDILKKDIKLNVANAALRTVDFKGGLDKSKSNSSKVSVLGSIAAGTPIEAIQHEVDKVALPEDLQKNGEYFGLKVKGDSMIEAGINDGDTVIIKKTSTADTGQIAVVLIDEQEATLKRIRKKGNTIALEAANKNYDTKIYASNRIKIQGRLISLYRNFH